MRLNTASTSTYESPATSHEIISLMLQYYNSTLSPTLNNRVENLISNCEECQKLYEDVKFFFSEDDTFMYEFLNQKKINNARKNFADFVSASSTEEENHFQEEIKNTQHKIFSGWDDDDCFCCGG